MDYAEHERTYDRFLSLTNLTIVVCINVLLDLLLFGFGSPVGVWLGFLTLILLVVAGAMGLAMQGSVKPSLAVTVIAVVFVVLTVG